MGDCQIVSTMKMDTVIVALVKMRTQRSCLPDRPTPWSTLSTDQDLSRDYTICPFTSYYFLQ